MRDVDAERKIAVGELQSAILSNHDLLISGEELSRFSLKELKGISTYFDERNYEVHAIGFLRPPYELLVSAYQQSLKAGNPPALNSNAVVKQRERVTKLQRAFQKITFLSFNEARRHEFGPCGLFFNEIGIDSPWDTSEKHDNQSLTAHAAAIIGYINSKKPALVDGKFNKERKKGDTMLLYSLGDRKLTLPEALMAPFMTDVQEANSWLESEFDKSFCDLKISADKNPLNWTRSELTELECKLPELDSMIVEPAKDFLLMHSQRL